MKVLQQIVVEMTTNLFMPLGIHLSLTMWFALANWTAPKNVSKALKSTCEVFSLTLLFWADTATCEQAWVNLLEDEKSYGAEMYGPNWAPLDEPTCNGQTYKWGCIQPPAKLQDDLRDLPN